MEATRLLVSISYETLKRLVPAETLALYVRTDLDGTLVVPRPVELRLLETTNPETQERHPYFTLKEYAP